MNNYALIFMLNFKIQQDLKNAKRPMIIVGSSCLQDASNGADILYKISKISNELIQSDNEDWKVLNVLHRSASQVGALDVGYKGGIGDLSNVKLLYLLGAVSL